MHEFGKRLLEVTKYCRYDMHEPDNQGLVAHVTGIMLDNAMGDNPHNNFGEFTVGLKIVDEHRDMFEYPNENMQWFNLATLIALARIGAKKIIKDGNVISE